MSDKTPESPGDSERGFDALGDESEDRNEATGVDKAVGGRRRTSPAPVRRDAAADPDTNDEAIAELEEGFTEDEQSAASEIRRSGRAPVKKVTATRKRSESRVQEHDPYSASNPAVFVRQSAGEIKKVVWPTWPQLTVLFFSVLIFVLFMIAFVGLLDMLFGWGLLATLGDS